jgi:hypothetical protein
MEKGAVTICVVNYKTLDLTRLCLRSIRKYTDYPCKVMVVDNDSQDASTDYLKSLKWIQFVSRTEKKNLSDGGYAHAAALDLGLSLCGTEYFMAMHSDTFVHSPGWLTELMRYFQQDPSVVCVGGGKCEITITWRQVLKMFDIKRTLRKILPMNDPLGMHRYYNRTVCTIYRTDVLKKENLSFLMDRDKGLTVGKKLYFELVDRGYKTVELSDAKMRQYLWHLAHATQVVNAGEYNLRGTTLRKTRRLLNRLMNSEQVREIAGDCLLDH